ncbi:MAG: hypothetical protein FD152_2260 [Xanthobacteraceae bacterium]|nr:MAG: hypothetical protein FD152_2260 [Xanthobacteraceae bacterium]
MKRSDKVRQLLGSLDAVRVQASGEGLETMRYLLDMAHAEGSIALAKIVYEEEDEKSRIGAAEALPMTARASPAAAPAGGS